MTPALSFALVFAAAIAAQPAFAKSDRPNIVVIMADDLGWGDLGCYPKGAAWGEEAHIPTPNLDALAASGMRCTQAYATCMVCSPSRAALLTGKYQQHFGFYAFAETAAALPRDLKLLPEALREAGYRTGMVGKWHVSSDPTSGPLQRGFEHFFGFIGGQHDYFEANIGETMQGVGYGADAYVFDQEKPVGKVKYLTEEFTDHAIDFMAAPNPSNQPFFLYLAYNAPHPPNQAPWDDLKPYAEKRANGKFTPRDIARASIGNLDRNVGRLTRWLREQGLDQNTLIIFTSDNGGSDGGPDNMLQHNGGLRGRKSTFYEGGIRIPFLIAWAGHLPVGAVYDKPISHLDIYATALAVAQGKSIKTHSLDGTNLIPYLLGKDKSAPHQQLCWSVDNPSHWAARDGDWKLVLEDTDPATLGRRDRVRKTELQLFNLATDPLEEKNILSDNPAIVARLQKQFAGFVAKSKPSLYTREVQTAHEAALAKRAANPALAAPHSRAGSPGHWNGGAKKTKGQAEP